MNSFKLINFFEEKLIDLNCERNTKAYIIGIFNKYKSAEDDLSKNSITLLFAHARNNRDFYTYQKIGDYLFFIQTMMPQYLKNSSKDYYDTIARLSYYNCYKIVNRQIKVYEQLADEFCYLESEVKNKLQNINETNHILVPILT